jgi:hypothetical protein
VKEHTDGVQLDVIEFERLGRFKAEVLDVEVAVVSAQLDAARARIRELELRFTLADRVATFNEELQRLSSKYSFDASQQWETDRTTLRLVPVTRA